MSIEMDAKVTKSSATAVATAMTTRMRCIALGLCVLEECVLDVGALGCVNATKL